VATLKQIRRAAAATAAAAVAAARAKAATEGTQDLEVDMEQGADLPEQVGDERRSEVSVRSRVAQSRVGSVTCSENVSEIEQQIMFNLLDRAGTSSLPGAPSRVSSASRLGIAVGGEEDLRSRSSVAGARQQQDAVGHLVLLRAGSDLSGSISEHSDESDSDEDSIAATSFAAALARAEVPAEQPLESPNVRLGSVCTI
jgi:hypothetical protein